MCVSNKNLLFRRNIFPNQPTLLTLKTLRVKRFRPVRKSNLRPLLLRSTYLPVLVTIISLVNSLNLIHKSASSSVSLISLSDASPFSLPFWNSLSTALRRCSRRWSELEEVIFPSSLDRRGCKTFSAGAR